MATFALVHGAWHGKWCWERVVPELESRGHHAITMDLPSDDPEATFETYADVVAEHLAHARDDVVLVGHSLAGLTIPLVPARRAVRRLVFLCALVPDLGCSFLEQLRGEEMLDLGYAEGLGDADPEGRRGWTDPGLAREFLFADCDDADANWAIARLRPQAPAPYQHPCSLSVFPDVPATYIGCRADRLVKPAWSRRVAKERLHADFLELPGSHSPFLSRPVALASALHALA